jgi:CDGSH iron-sulfur domain-containing protein 3
MNQAKIAQKSPVVLDMPPGVYYWCACGGSKTQPFCDGSHHDTPFSPIEIEVREPKNVAWCACKQSKKAPFCDGSHSRLT